MSLFEDRPGRGPLRRLSRRTDGVPQSAAGRRAGAFGKDLLQATERLLGPSPVRHDARETAWPKDKISLRVRQVDRQYKMAKHFELDIADQATSNPSSIGNRAGRPLQSCISLTAAELDAEGTVRRLRPELPSAPSEASNVDLNTSSTTRDRVRARDVLVHARLLRRMAHAPTDQPRFATTMRPPPRPTRLSWRRRRFPNPPRTRPGANARRTAFLCTASRRCSVLGGVAWVPNAFYTITPDNLNCLLGVRQAVPSNDTAEFRHYLHRVTMRSHWKRG